MEIIPAAKINEWRAQYNELEVPMASAIEAVERAAEDVLGLEHPHPDNLAHLRTMVETACPHPARRRVVHLLGYSATLQRIDDSMAWNDAAWQSWVETLNYAWALMWEQVDVETILNAVYALGTRPGPQIPTEDTNAE